MPCFSSFRDGVGERGSRANPAEKRYHCDGRTSRAMVLVYRRPSVVMWMEGSVRATAAAVSSRHPSKVKLVTGAGRELIPCVFFVVTTLHRDVMCSDFVTSFNSHRVPPLLPTSVSLALSHHPISVALVGFGRRCSSYCCCCCWTSTTTRHLVIPPSTLACGAFSRAHRRRRLPRRRLQQIRKKRQSKEAGPKILMGTYLACHRRQPSVVY